MNKLAENLRYALWRSKVPRNQWEWKLATWANCDVARARRVLHEELAVSDEVIAVMKKQWPDADVTSDRLIEVDGIDILAQNLSFFADSLEHGEKKRLCKRIKVSPATLSRWIAGDHRPHRKRLRAICDYFEVPAELDITIEPMFLWLHPMSTQQQREWVCQRIDEIPSELWSTLFPKIYQLLNDSSS